MLSTLGNLTTLGLLGSRDGSTRVFSSNTDTEEESKIPDRR